MELKIFNSILFDSLMPWLCKSADETLMAENLKKIGDADAKTIGEVSLQLQILLSKKPDLLNSLKGDSKSDYVELIALFYNSTLPEFTDATTKYYSDVIDKEAARVFSSFISVSKDWTDKDIINYRTEMILRDLKKYIITVSQEIRKRGFSDIVQTEMELVPFVLYYLKYKLIILYFSIQDAKNDALENTITLMDFYLTVLHEKKNQIRELYPIIKTVSGKNATNQKSEKLSFGFRGKKDKLRTVINQLCDEIDLLNEDVSPADEFLDLLTSRDIKPGMKRIQINCDNKNFRHVIEKLMPHFENLTYINIERSECFYSKKGTKPMTSNDFSKAKSYTPKLKEEIDSIFQQMQ